jgi:hypothetical protein
MAGQPKTKRMLAELNALIDADGLAHRCEDGEEYILRLIEGGASGVKISKHYGYSRQMFDVWVDSVEGRREKVKAARKAAAESHADEGAKILEELALKNELQSAEVSLAQSRAKYKQWQAEKADPQQFGQPQQQTQVNVSFGDLHMSALLSHGLVKATQEGPILPAEIIEDDAIAALTS